MLAVFVQNIYSKVYGKAMRATLNGSGHKNTERDLQNQIFTFVNEKIGFPFLSKYI